jgi:hypothetical protein
MFHSYQHVGTSNGNKENPLSSRNSKLNELYFWTLSIVWCLKKLRNKIYIPKNHNTHVQNSHKGQLLTTEPLTWGSGWVICCHRCLTCFKGLCVYAPRKVALWLVIDPCVNFGRVYCDIWYIYFYSLIFWDTRRWIKSKSTIRSVYLFYLNLRNRFILGMSLGNKSHYRMPMWPGICDCRLQCAQREMMDNCR